jgi:hypothetical protein
VGKHVIQARVQARPARVLSRPRVLFSLAFFASIGVVMVNVIDPYSGAVASPYFQPAIVAHREGQSVVLAGSYSNTAARDGVSVSADQASAKSTASDAAAGAPAPVAGVPDPDSAQAIGLTLVTARGWGSDQFDCLVSLWNRESHWNAFAQNTSSGAYGIPQALPGSKMASAGDDWQTNPATQITWGLGYISGRYGSPCGAWAHSQALGWY